MSQIMPTAEPFLFPGSRTGCLLTHGFTGAPKEMRWMGQYLAAQGFSVLGVRLAGHATRPEDMIRMRWTDWVASVEDGYHQLSGLVDHIYLVGLSMGGVLSLLLSTQLIVKGVVAISTPAELPRDPRLPYLALLSRVRPFMPKDSAPPGSGWFDQEARQDHVSYPQNPVRAIAELHTLIVRMRAALPEIRVPVLLIHSQDDGFIVPSNMERIYAELTGTPDKTKLLVNGSGHVATRDAARQQIFEAVENFILRVESARA